MVCKKTTTTITIALCIGVIIVFFYQQYQQQVHTVSNNRDLKVKKLNTIKSAKIVDEKISKESTTSPASPTKNVKQEKKRKTTPKNSEKRSVKPTKTQTRKGSNKAANLGWNLTGKFYHDRTAFTQGLEIEDEILYETTGLYGGRSSLRRVDMKTGKVLKEVPLGSQYFGEGMTIWKDNIVVLTWKKRLGFVFDKKTFKKKEEFPFRTANGQGWGITHDDKQLIVSDGTDNIFFWDPETFKEHRRIKVKWNGRPVRKVNELEYISMDDGKDVILANIWYKDDVIAIDPIDGKVIAVYDMGSLVKKKDTYGGEDCLNGIAYNKKTGIVYLTGKLYQHVYKLRLENIGKHTVEDL